MTDILAGKDGGGDHVCGLEYLSRSLRVPQELNVDLPPVWRTRPPSWLHAHGV